MTMGEWVEIYNHRNSQDPFVRDKRYDLYFNPDHGFCEAAIGGNMLIINQLCGNAIYFRDALNRAAKAMGITHGGTWCIRPEIKAYIRLFGYHIDRVEKLSDGLKRYYCTNKKTKKKGIVSPSFYYKNGGRQAYFITWEI